jgi:tetratricopeptide (TPR) repeat protein
VPVAHEDDAERAVRAALDLVAAVPGVDAGLAARAAVVSGEAAVTLGAEGQGMVAGDLVNTASRLQGHAEAGTVLVSDATRLATERAVIYESAGSASLKGKTLPVETWRAVRVRLGIGGRLATEELELPFVGREAELRMLTEMYHATARESRLRLVSVTGQAGIGKSRLSRELEAYLDGIRQRVYWHRGRCPSYGEGLTYWAIGEMVRRRAGIAESDGPEQTAERIEVMLDEFVTEPAERARIEPAVRALVGLDTRGWSASETGELYAAWRILFERIAERAPTVLVFEDVQWADAGLVGFIQHLLEWSRTQPILVVTLARPEFLEAHPTWGAGLRHFTSLYLEPLPEETIVDLLETVVPGLPPAAARRIAGRAEGIPLYAVETLRMLLAQGVLVRGDGQQGTFRLVGDLSDVAVPDSLRGLVAARLDLLPAAARSLTQDAAVLGQSFPLEGLAAITGQEPQALEPDLRELVRREILRVDTDPRSPERGQYIWVQAVLREVAYGMLSKRDRRARHLAAARYFERLADQESAGVVADHYVEAWRASSDPEEAAALAGPARVALRAASERAERLGNFMQAASYVDRKVELTEDAADRAAFLERSGELNSRAGSARTAEARYRAALEALPPGSSEDDVARLTAEVGRHIIAELRLDEAIDYLEVAAARLGPALEAPGRVALEGQLGRAYGLSHRRDDAEVVLRRTIEAGERIGPEDALIEAIISYGSTTIYDGRLSGLAMLFGSVELARRAGLVRAEMRALNNLSAWAGDADPPLARELAKRIVDLSDKTGYSQTLFQTGLPIMLAWTDSLEAALLRAREITDRLEPGGRDELEMMLTWLTLAQQSGDWDLWDAARATLEAAPDANPEAEDWRTFTTALGLLLRGHVTEAADVVHGSCGLHVVPLAALTGLLRREPREVERALESSEERRGFPGPYRSGLHGIGRAGLGLLDDVNEPDLDAYLRAVDVLRGSELADAWTMGVVTFIELAGAEPAQVRTAVTELRAHLERVGAQGCLEALDSALARAAEQLDAAGVAAPGVPAQAKPDGAALAPDAAVAVEP